MAYHITLEGRKKEQPSKGANIEDGLEFEKKLNYANLGELHKKEFNQHNILPARQGAKGA